METRLFHGDLKAGDIVDALVARFNRGNLIAQKVRGGEQLIVQITTRQRPTSGGRTALGVTLQQNEEGVTVQLGKQSWLGIAASLGATALSALKNPLSLLGRLDDLAQDIEHLQLDEDVWETINEVARTAGASYELSERLRSSVCPYCEVANPVGEPRCIACGAPLGEAQPGTCPHCGFVVSSKETTCTNCGKKI